MLAYSIYLVSRHIHAIRHVVLNKFGSTSHTHMAGWPAEHAPTKVQQKAVRFRFKRFRSCYVVAAYISLKSGIPVLGEAMVVCEGCDGCDSCDSCDLEVVHGPPPGYVIARL